MDEIEKAQEITEPATVTPVQIDTVLERLDGVIQQWAGVLHNKDLVHLHDRARATRDAALAEFVRLDAEHTRRGWTRYLAVTGGHVHSEYRCAGLKWNTRRNWFPTMSGMALTDAIGRFAETMCTHCFPSAPVADTEKPGECRNTTWSSEKPHRSGYAVNNWAICSTCGARATLGRSNGLIKHLTPVALKAAAQAKQARLEAEVAADVKRMMFRGEAKTVVAVQREASRLTFDLRWYGSLDAEERATLTESIVALATKLGRPVEELTAEVDRKACAKVRREGGTPR